MSRKKILLIDDSETILMMERMVLRRAYDIVTAKDGSEGISKAISERPDLILLDVNMPVLDGFAVCRLLRVEDALKDTPIVMVTSRGEADSVELGFRSGCSDYIMKPIDSLELLAKVRGCLGDSLEDHG